MPHVLAAVAAQHSSGGGDTFLVVVDVLLVLIGVVIGRLWGRRAGLKHLGTAEFKTRWSTVRKQRKW